MAFLRAICRGVWWSGIALCALAAAGCNSPYPDSEEGEDILYTTFSEEPKHLDPARSYSTNQSIIICQILEPPFQYHFLKRPYVLVPLTAKEVPKPEKRNVRFQDKAIEATVYTVRLKPGIEYQEHPCFFGANRRLSGQDVQGVRNVWDIKPTATRELVAADYVYGIRRLADPRLACPIFSTLKKNLLGLGEYQEKLERVLEEKRREREEAAGRFYNKEQDEKYNPIRLDYHAEAKGFPFVREVDRYAFEVVLQHPYPQILYWMAMAFFAPVPPEAIEFFDQRVLLERSILFDKNPVGTGPYRLVEFDPANQMVLQRNENFRDERYPDLPPPADDDPDAREAYEKMKAVGMLEDVGRRLPMIDRIVFRMEKEGIPRWNKFLQGYYDTSGISSDLFDQAITLTSRGDSVLSEGMAEKGIRLLTSYPTTVSYYAFNMKDPVFGGYTDRKRKLRQAISIAFDVEEYVTIFTNDRNIPAQSPVPKGIFGHEPGRAGMNPVVYRWDPDRKRRVRRDLGDAVDLLAEAGYVNGRGPDGRPLVVRFAITDRGPGDRARLNFIKEQFKKLKIRVDFQSTDYNRFQDKVRSGNFQFLGWGWVADYPDPENFLFLLHGPNSKVKAGGENVANYGNKRYDELFLKMQSMENTPERLGIIREMIGILQKDAPWIFGDHPVAFGLYHKWFRNAYPHGMAFNTTKYKRIDAAARTEYRSRYNQPRLWPAFAFLGLVVVCSIPAVVVGVRQFREA